MAPVAAVMPAAPAAMAAAAVSPALFKIYGGAPVVNKVDDKLRSVLSRRANFGLRIIRKLLVTNT